MAAKKKTLTDPREKLLTKLQKAGSKGESESKLLGKNADRAVLAALNSLEQESVVKKYSSDPGAKAVTQWFIMEAAPEPVAQAVENECASRQMTLWKPEDILKKLPKYYSQNEAAAALKQICASPQVLKFKDGKAFKYTHLPEARPAQQQQKGYFISEAARYIYALVVLDGENQQRELGLMPSHYRDAKLAKSWRDSIARKVHPDICHHSQAHQASDALDRLYRRMLG